MPTIYRGKRRPACAGPIPALGLAALTALAGLPADAATRELPTRALPRLCGKTVRENTTVRAGAVEITSPDGCFITVARGATLRLVGVDLRLAFLTPLSINLIEGAALEVIRSRLNAGGIGIGGEGGGRYVLIEDSSIETETGAGIRADGDVTVVRSHVGAGPGGVGFTSTGGTVELHNSTAGGRDGASLHGERAAIARYSSFPDLSLGTGDGGDIYLLGSIASYAVLSSDLTTGEAPRSIVIIGNQLNPFRPDFPIPVLFQHVGVPAICTADANTPSIACPWSPDERPVIPAGPGPDVGFPGSLED